MADYDLLIIRLDGLTSDLQHAKAALGSDQLGDLAGLVRDRFGIQLGRLQSSVDDLVASLGNEEAPRRKTWDEYRKFREQSDRVIEECADFIQGALTRNAAIDLGSAEVADDLAGYLDEITQIGWSRMTIFGAMDFTTRSSGIIRLAFPHFDVWSIPIVGHEFGHHVLEELRDATGALDEEDNEVFPIRDVIEDHQATIKRRWLRELFSDLFATYSLGPAYVMSLIFGQLDAVFPLNPSKTHPQSSWRAAFALDALRRLDDGSTAKTYEAVAKTIEDVWSEAVTASGNDAALPDEEAAMLRQVLDDFWTALADNTPQRLEYASWTRARQLSQNILDQEGNGGPPYGFVKSSDTVVDVLNGAWRARLVGEMDVDAIGDISLRIAQDVTAGGD